MLRTFFPSTDAGANLYGGFMHDTNFFSKVFDLSTSVLKTLKEINVFLCSNGYEAADHEAYSADNGYVEGPVSISKHGYQDQMVLIIERDSFAKPQSQLLINELVKFRDERDWSQFHNPKDLSVALSIEANELLECFLWKSSEKASEEKVKEELADVLAYAFLLANNYRFDIEEIVLEKIKKNGKKYPVEKAKGTAKKYNEL
jgi:NTP pyrophosphatase (non-canonical NTP hydrolase)